ncbi:ATP synthase F1, delta subunit [Trichuris trichiura]|uniref:ATP synthase F1, delta subunit n=1 Tax=Trichuris trichiura TaxID=36087 RepID=A0A077Z1M9_TRITR|nr:ATP synthase F1, delta subunit [Trichuris trichiura]
MFELVITLSKLMFTHHSLFSKEDVLCRRLLELYNVFQSRLRENLSYHYAQQLALVRTRFHECKIDLETSDSESVAERENKIEMLLSECRELRRRRNEEEAKDHLLLQKIVSTWNNIKRLRKVQRYTTTSFKLTLQKYEVDAESDKDAWKADLLDDLEEREFENKDKQAKDDVSCKDNNAFDGNAAWTEICKEALRSRRNPGLTSASVASNSNREEKSRRQQITKHKVMLKLFYNGKEVCSTASRPLNLDFCVALGSSYSLLVKEWPKSITLKLYESTGYDWNYLATLGVPLPSDRADNNCEADEVSEIEFSSELRAIYANSGVGAGELVRLEEFGIPAFIPHISGVLRLSVRWGKGKDGNPLVPVRKNARLSETEAKNDADKKGIEPPSAQANVMSTPSVRLSLQPMVCELDTKEGTNRNAIYRIMSHHSGKTFSESQFTMSTKIDEDIREYDVQVSNELSEYKELETCRCLAEKAQSVRFCLLHWLTHHKQQTYDTIVSREKESAFHLTSEQSLRTHRRSFAQPPLPLKGGMSIDGQFRLLVGINRCNNVPARSDRNVIGAKVFSGTKPLKQIKYVFIVRFRGKWTQSTFADGPNPIWNQTISMMIRLFSSAQMGFKASDSLRLDLFEQESTEIPKDLRKDDHTVCHKIERRWLGYVKISLSSIIAQKRLYGSFELATPKWLLNYQVQKEKQRLQPFNRCYAHLSIRIEPIPHIGQVAIRLFHGEDEQLISYGQSWLKSLCKRHRYRNYVAFVFDMHGRSVFVPRYLRRIQPPPEVVSLKSNKRAAVLFACRLVSLIPKDNDVIVKPEVVQIWSTIEETLQTMRAQEAEHATLLCCWLLGLEIPCFLLLGTDACNGPYAAYVMVKLSQILICNPSTGKVYERNDPLCPIWDVACAVGPDNIWANMQKSGHPTSLSFNFTNSVYWVPFWSKQFEQRQLSSVQPENVTYSLPNMEMSLKLETRLRKVVTEHLMKWRPESLTRFNRFAGQCFREVLVKLEEGTVDLSSTALFPGTVKSLFSSYKIFGFAINQGFLAEEDILDTVAMSDICNFTDSSTEFALAVYVHGYSCSVYSVWLLVGCLTKIRPL